MKKIIKTVIPGILSGILFLSSCTDLTEKVYSNLEEGNFYQTEEDMLGAMVPVYSTLRQLTDWRKWWDFEETTDVVMTPTRAMGWFDGGIYQRLHKHTWNVEDPHFDDFWNQAFSGINTANRVIYQLGRDNIVFEGKEKLIAELKCMRAYWYFLLIEAFGNVPIVDRFDVEEGYMPETASREEVFTFMEKDLLENINLLSEDPVATYGRCNKWVAKAILARMYLNAETWLGKSMYTQCMELCNEIITSGKYQLENDFSAIFALDNHNSKEIIFAVPFDETMTSGDKIYMAMQKTLHPSSKETWNIKTWLDNGICGVPSFMDNYAPEDTRLKKTWHTGQQYAADGVTPLLCTGLVPGWQNRPLIYTQEVSSLEDAGEADGYRCFKYELKMGSEYTPDNDWVAIRYAEILYMKAECLLRSGGNSSEAAELVNSVRSRSFSTPKLLTSTDLEATVNVNNTPVQFGNLLIEWGCEFALEGLRRSQLIRFDNNYINGTWTFHEPSGNTNLNLFPIPFNQRATNNKLKQNPGYNE